MPVRTLASRRPLLLASLACAVAYYFIADSGVLPGVAVIVLKGAGVALLAAYAWLRHSGRDAHLLALVMGLSALGDMAIELSAAAGGGMFLLSHLAAILLYSRNRRASTTPSQKAAALALLFLTPVIAWILVSQTDGAIGVAIYALVLGAMAASAWTSRFPRYQVGIGAVMFVISDLLIFADMELLSQSPIPGWLIWPLYFIGQFMIATGIIQTLRGERSDSAEEIA
ncbi:lysoplasmalogenase [Altererythrobacter aquiaggeris]|uniref:lysoplasmalogenase n=1 Tax=Aestuarierythrobacter aquiaggeris TaxID=1898396 RepID=UPI00301AF8DF